MKHLVLPLLILALFSIVTERALNQIALEKGALEETLFLLKQEKEKAIQKQNKLLLTINSQSDPAWVELVLFKELGLIPEGDTKIWFQTEH